MIPIDDTILPDLAALEQAKVLATAEHHFFGLQMQQHPQAVVRLNQLLNAIQPRNIVEIGAGECGLSVLFALYAVNTGGRYGAFDIIRGKHAPLLERIVSTGVLNQVDVLTVGANVKAMQDSLRALEGRTLLVCDAGKALEYRLYAPSLKQGDWVMMHDYAPDRETFERDIKGRVWNWFEAWDERVEDVARECGIVNVSHGRDVVWSIGVKTR